MMRVSRMRDVVLAIGLSAFLLFCCNTLSMLPCHAAEVGGPVDPDRYEPDNTPAQAAVIVLSDSPQQHNFHASGDPDWVKFYGIAQNVYTIDISSPGPACDAVIEVYDGDGLTLLEQEDDYRQGEEEKLDWVCPQDGTYYIKIRNYDPAVYGSSTEYGLSIYYPTGPGGTGIIQGLVKNKTTGSGIGNAIIRTDGGCSTISNPDGAYLMLHHTGLFNLTATAEGYQLFTKQINVQASQPIPLNIDMLPIDQPPDDCTTPPCCFEKIYAEGSGEIKKLRTFRDTVLSRSSMGRKLIEAYYDACPAITTMIKEDSRAQKIIKRACDLLLLLL